MISIHVTIELLQGNIAEVRAFWNEHLAEMAEQCWLKDNNIRSKLDREAKARTAPNSTFTNVLSKNRR